MGAKKKRIVLNMQQRLDVLKDLRESSLTNSKIGKKYGVNAKTIQRIKKNATKISSFEDKSKCEKKRRIIVNPLYADLDKHLLAWYLKRHKEFNPLTDAIMLKKALDIKASFPSCSGSKVSRGWLSKFKKRHGIRLSHVSAEKSITDIDDANKFIADFKKLINEENINLENIYSMSESQLAWKALPAKTLMGDKEENISGYKLRKDRITIALCANALGTHKIMPLIIYKYKNPRALKHEVSLTVILKSQVNASMDQTIFLDWFENYFKPSVRKYQSEKAGKIILLLDTCESHKVTPKIEADEHFKMMYLPRNITSLIQPMDRGVIDQTKKIFRHKLLQRVVTYENGINNFYKDYSIKNCIDILSSSWSEITYTDIRNAWNKLIIEPIPLNFVQDTIKLEPEWRDMISTITGEECTQRQVTEFLSVCDEIDRKNEEMDIKEGIVPEEEPSEEPNEIIFHESNNEAVRNELRQIFEQLSVYGRRAPTCIQHMVQGLRMFFLGRE